MDKGPRVRIHPITQASTATFADLYIKNTSLFFIEQGSKRVETSGSQEIIGQTGDIIVFAPDSIVTIENRTWSGSDYRAIGVSFANDLVGMIYPVTPAKRPLQSVHVVSPPPNENTQMLDIIRKAQMDANIPTQVYEHRLLEVLIWMKTMGVQLFSPMDKSPLGQVRTLIESDLTHPWRSKEVADNFAMSEATMRRWLAQSGGRFSRILINARLEKGLSLLQTTAHPISKIALDCGFKTPSHFSDSFKTRFGIQPKALRSSNK